MPITVEKHERLQEIKDQIKEMLDEARNIIRHSGDDVAEERFKGYVLGNILPQLDSDHDFLAGSMVSFQDVIDSLEVEDDEDEEIDEEDEVS
jgi:hypothetical protein